MKLVTAFLILMVSALPGLAHSPYFSAWSCKTGEGYFLRFLGCCSFITKFQPVLVVSHPRNDNVG
ncbi:hypothetical protein GP644_03305 [Parasedimentitalea maritima]|uniref:Uncharacterized protein n=1 Tax=Parasedimentitalea maritima TaxID=2578117 RepID=A0A6A4RQE1_9RHOB|nr:hypothetical protein GP644_03305 [Zongyanglinia marina]